MNVTISPAKTDVHQGRSQAIKCTVTGKPAAITVLWLFTPTGSNQQKTLSTTNSVKYSGGTIRRPSLTVLNFQSSDGGTYECSATNAVGTRTSAISVLRFIR